MIYITDSNKKITNLILVWNDSINETVYWGLKSFHWFYFLEFCHPILGLLCQVDMNLIILILHTDKLITIWFKKFPHSSFNDARQPQKVRQTPQIVTPKHSNFHLQGLSDLELYRIIELIYLSNFARIQWHQTNCKKVMVKKMSSKF